CRRETRKVHDMTLATESNMAAKAEKIQHETSARGPGEQPRGSKPVRRVRWFIIVGILLAILVGGPFGSAGR
ncbi:MAG: hypothetical protein J0H20_08340, partial [Rhizobiales bacterium]|nr:hypothetical protein [Hyphomicrobiales bacterium]